MFGKWIWICLEISVLVYGSSSGEKSSSSSSSSSSNNLCAFPCTGCSFDGINKPITTNEINKFEGTWFEVKRSRNGVDGGRCRMLEVSCTSPTELALTVSAYFQWSNDDTPAETTADLVFYQNSHKFMYISKKITEDGTCLLTLETDYTSFWIVVVQQIDDDKDKEKEVFVSVLTRKAKPDDTTWSKINTILGRADIVPLFVDIQLYLSAQDGCSAAVPSVGCPATGVPVKADLDLKKYLGTWYVLYHQDSSLLGQCPSQLFYGSGSALSFYRRNLAIGTTASGTTKYTTSGGPAVLQSDGQFCVTVSALGEGKPMCWYYWVLDTDYENYAVVVTCSTLKFNIPVESAMILGRDVWLSTELYNKAWKVLTNAPLILSGSLPDIDFTNCPRDTCPSWVTKQHFDPFQFSGDWIEVKTYSLPKISGDPNNLCRTTRYTPTRNNSIYIQQPVQGNAEIVITKKESRPLNLLDHDGSYEVTVKSKSGPEKLQYHFILDTDYNNWTVIMKCQGGKQEDDPVDLTVEVLIRAGDYFNGPLLDEVESALKTKYNLALANFQDSSKSSCSGNACAQASQGMKNFKPEEYKGRWFVVRETPNSDATGRCSYQTIQQDGATDEFKLSFTQYDRSSKSYESEVVEMHLSNLTVGNFREIVNGSGEPRSYSVLYTDHTTMALVYFCSGMEERVQVLSRKTTLTAADEVIMLDAIINNYLDASLLNDVVQGADNCPAITPSPSSSGRALQVPGLASVLVVVGVFSLFSAGRPWCGG